MVTQNRRIQIRFPLMYCHNIGACGSRKFYILHKNKNVFVAIKEHLFIFQGFLQSLNEINTNLNQPKAKSVIEHLI